MEALLRWYEEQARHQALDSELCEQTNVLFQNPFRNTCRRHALLQSRVPRACKRRWSAGGYWQHRIYFLEVCGWPTAR